MSHTNNLQSPPEAWTTRSETMNPAPTMSAKDTDSRDTASGCRQRASADLLQALEMTTMNGRQVYEKSAASWAKRAEMLQRIETGIEARQSAPARVELTSYEIAEDLASLKL